MLSPPPSPGVTSQLCHSNLSRPNSALGRGGIRNPVSRGIALANQRLRPLGHRGSYLGTLFDSKLSFSENTDHIYKKCMQHLYLLRKLQDFGVSQNILEMVYKSLILAFNMTTCYRNLSTKDKNKLPTVVNSAGEIIGQQQKQLTITYMKNPRKKPLSRVNDVLNLTNCHQEGALKRKCLKKHWLLKTPTYFYQMQSIS